MDTNQGQTDALLFSYCDKWEREMLTNAYEAIQQTELWPFMKEDIFSYMFGVNPEIKMIQEKMSALGYDGHSGSSFGWTMREMQFIAQNGLEAHKNKYLKKLHQDDLTLILEFEDEPVSEATATTSEATTSEATTTTSEEELQQVKDEISEKVNYSSAEEGISALLNNPEDIANRIKGAFTEFKDKVGRNMTYSEMRSIMG